MIHEIAESAQASQKQDSCNIYAIMKTMYPPGYHCNGFVVTHALALGKMIYGDTFLVPMNQKGLNKLSKELILCPSCFCEIWALCVSWIAYGHLYYAPCLACCELFGSFVPAMCNRTSWVQVHELPQSHFHFWRVK